MAKDKKKIGRIRKEKAAGCASAHACDLGLLRHRIDDLDKRIVELLNARAEVVVEVGKAKLAAGSPIYAPDRERAVLDRISRLSKGPLPDKSLRAIYREMMSGSFALEKPLCVGYLGPEGSFSHCAAMGKFGSSVDYRPLADIRAVFEEVTRGHCDLGMVPIENSVGGGVIDTMDAFIGANVYVCGEAIVSIHHNLLARCPASQIKAIASKPEVFSQCRNWLSSSFKQVDIIPVASSSKAAELASRKKGLAAIGSTLAGELYELDVIFANIEDNPNNMTRFFVISSAPARRSGHDKTAIAFTTAHRSGALVSVLNIFARYGINLTNIATRPSMKRNWEYYFFIDAVGHCDDANMAKSLKMAREYCGELHVLGSFPCANEVI